MGRVVVVVVVHLGPKEKFFIVDVNSFPFIRTQFIRTSASEMDKI